MNHLNKLFVLMCFTFALGCGEPSTGNAQSQGDASYAAVAQPAPATDNGAKEENVAPEAAGVAEAAGSSDVDMSSVVPVDYVEGTHFERLPKPVPTADKSKIEVTEVFWYGCSHCYDFESQLIAWSSGLAKDVVLVKSPAMWDNQGVMENHARIYYTAKVLGVADKITPAAFRALNVDRNPLRAEEEIARLFTDNGVSREDFDRTFNSFGVTSAVRQAEARQRSYRIQGTPEMIVNGTYRVTGRMAGSHEAVLKVVDYLIERTRSETTGS